LQLKKWRKNKISDLTENLNMIQKIMHKASSNRKLYVFLFCLILSIFFWILNALSKNFTTEAVFNVSYVNQPKDKVVLNELPNEIKLKIKGLGFDLMAYKLRLKKSSVNVDLSRLKGFNGKSKTNVISSTSFLPYVSNQLGNQIEIKEIYPDSIHFLFDERVEKKVKVIPITKLTFKKQFQLYGQMSIKPAVVKVIGPASILDTLSSVFTQDVVLSNLAETTTEIVEFRLAYSSKKIVFKPEKIILHIPVEKYTESTMMLKINTTNVPDTIEIRSIPDEVELKFLLPLSKMASLANAKFIAEIDYTQISDNFNQKLKVELVEYPDYIQSPILNPGKVEYILKKRK
jgi:hypothetical protein